MHWKCESERIPMLHVYMKSLIRKLDASCHQQREVDSPYIIVLPGPPHRVGDRLGNAHGAHRTKEDGRPGSSAGTSPSTQIKGGGARCGQLRGGVITAASTTATVSGLWWHTASRTGDQSNSGSGFSKENPENDVPFFQSRKTEGIGRKHQKSWKNRDFDSDPERKGFGPVWVMCDLCYLHVSLLLLTILLNFHENRPETWSKNVDVESNETNPIAPQDLVPHRLDTNRSSLYKEFRYPAKSILMVYRVQVVKGVSLQTLLGITSVYVPAVVQGIRGGDWVWNQGGL